MNNHRERSIPVDEQIQTKTKLDILDELHQKVINIIVNHERVKHDTTKCTETSTILMEATHKLFEHIGNKNVRIKYLEQMVELKSILSEVTQRLEQYAKS